MHKDFVPPVSIEEFAAYLDGNLTDDGMEYISSVISNNQNLADIAEISDVVDDITEQYILDDDLQLLLLENMNFYIPDISDDTVTEQYIVYNENASAIGETENIIIN